jgi:hypothetical protein
MKHMDTYILTHDPSNLRSYHHAVCHINDAKFIWENKTQSLTLESASNNKAKR